MAYQPGQAAASQQPASGPSSSGGVSVSQALSVLSSAVNTAKGRAALAVLRGELGGQDRAGRASNKFQKGRPPRPSQSSGGGMPSKGSVRQMMGGNQ